MKKILLLLMILIIGICNAYSQEKITGTVIDNETGEALSFVSVVVKGTGTAVTTDENGSFSITAPATGILVFSFIGYETAEVEINGK